MKSILPGDMTVKRILVCQLRQIGDVLLATPSIKLLAEKFPQAEIHVLTEKKCAPVLENNPDIDMIWPIDKRELTSLPKELAYYWKVARQGFDIVIDFQQLPRCRWVVGFSRARIRLSGLAPWYNRWLYTHQVDPPENYAAMYKAGILAPLGIVWNNNRPRLYLSQAEKRWAAEYLAGLGLTGQDILVSVDSTHRRQTRRWPGEYFAKTLAMTAQAEPRLKFLLLYGPGEKDDVAELAKMSGLPPTRAILTEDMLSLRQMGACINMADLHFGTCSAPRHMAVAVDTPSLVVRGSTSVAWDFPSPEHKSVALRLKCQPCNHNHCPDPICLINLLPETVAERLLSHLKEFAGKAK